MSKVFVIFLLVVKNTEDQQTEWQKKMFLKQNYLRKKDVSGFGNKNTLRAR